MLCAVSKQSQSKSPSTPTHHVFPPLFPHLSLFLTHSSPATPCLSCLLLDQAGPCPALGRQRIQALLAMAPPSVPLSPGRSLGSGSALTPLFPLQKLQCLLLRKPSIPSTSLPSCCFCTALITHSPPQAFTYLLCSLTATAPYYLPKSRDSVLFVTTIQHPAQGPAQSRCSGSSCAWTGVPRFAMLWDLPPLPPPLTPYTHTSGLPCLPQSYWNSVSQVRSNP